MPAWRTIVIPDRAAREVIRDPWFNFKMDPGLRQDDGHAT
jgi:hypothetical protein